MKYFDLYFGHDEIDNNKRLYLYDGYFTDDDKLALKYGLKPIDIENLICPDCKGHAIFLNFCRYCEKCNNFFIIQGE